MKSERPRTIRPRSPTICRCSRWLGSAHKFRKRRNACLNRLGRVTRRWGVDLATVNLCCVVEKSGKARFAYGAVAPQPVLVEDASCVLSDSAAKAEEKDAVLRRLISHTNPRTDVRGGSDYREAMLMVMSRRALTSAMERLRAAA